MLIEVRYSCWACNLRKVSCSVPTRGEEDVITWMKATIAHLAEDHRRRSPDCTPVDNMLHDIMIPISGANKVGGPAVQ